MYSISTDARAAEVKLLSGKVIEGEIVERNDELIKIDMGMGIPIIYFLDEIESIDEEPASPTETEPAETVEPPETVEGSQKKETTAEATAPVQEEKLQETVIPFEQQEPNVEKEIEKTEETISPETTEIETTQEEPDKLQKEVIAETETVTITPETDVKTEKEKPEEITEPIIEPEIKEAQEMIMPATEEIPPPPSETAEEPVQKEEPQKVIPKEEVATLEGIDVFKPQDSPVAIKPKELPASGQKQMPEVETNTEPAPPDMAEASNKENFITKFSGLLKGPIERYEAMKSSFKAKAPHIKKKLNEIPPKVRRDILLLMTLIMGFLYVFISFPLMFIARKLGRKHIWLILIPVIQIFYFIYIAKRSLWLAILFFVPIINVILPLFLFADILKLMNKSRWLTLLFLIPVVNLLVLWYLAFAKIN